MYTSTVDSAVESAMLRLKPQVNEYEGYWTPRSHLEVTTFRVTDNQQQCVGIHIDGPVDKHDAAQLAEFFSALSSRLPMPGG